jgi:hypothetical protein
LMEWELTKETEVLGENQRHFVHHKSQTIWPGIERGPPRWEAGDWPHELPTFLLQHWKSKKSKVAPVLN